MRVVYNFSMPANQRVQSITVLCTNCTIPQYEPLQEDEVYTTIMPKFLADGGDNFLMFREDKVGIRHLGINYSSRTPKPLYFI